MNNIFSFDLNHFRLWILFAITGIVEMLVIGHCANIPGQHRILFGQGIASDDYIQRKVQSTHPPRMRVSVSPSLCLSLSSLDSSGVPFTQLSIVSMTDVRTDGPPPHKWLLQFRRWLLPLDQGLAREILATLTSYQRDLNVSVYWPVKDALAKMPSNLE